MKNYTYYISVLLVFLVIFYLNSIKGLLEFSLFIILYGTIFYGIFYTYKRIRKQSIEKYKSFLVNFIKKTSLSIVILVIIVGTFGYYQINVSPALMIEYTISNGKKEIIFQEMSHIGAKSFYGEVKKNLLSYKKDSFVYFYEGVKPGREENHTKFNKAMGIKFDEDLYKNFSKLYGVSFQDNSIYLGLINELDFNVDVGIDFIIEQYEKKKHLSTSQPTKLLNKDVIDINSEIIDKLSSLNERQLKALVFVNKAILNTLIKSDKAQKIITNNFANKELFEVILNGRNEVLVNEIIKSEYNKIYITYGKLHFKGVLKLLQNQDPNWKITNKRELISIK